MKRRIVRIDEQKCNGCGLCISACHEGALQLVNGKAKLITDSYCDGLGACLGECPQGAIIIEERQAAAFDQASQLRQWPIQLHLVPVSAPYWQGAAVLISADCVAHAYGSFQDDLLNGRRLIVACPKLDDTGPYVAKLQALFAQNDIKSVAVAHMEVPCCNGIVRMVEEALAGCGKAIPYSRVRIGIHGEVQERTQETVKQENQRR